jgi:hypothetical protein
MPVCLVNAVMMASVVCSCCALYKVMVVPARLDASADATGPTRDAATMATAVMLPPRTFLMFMGCAVLSWER